MALHHRIQIIQSTEKYIVRDQNLVRKRLDVYKKNPGTALDFVSAMDDIEKARF